VNKLNKIKLTIAIFALILVGCSDDDNPVSSSVTLTEGTYNMTDGTVYDTADCSGAGYSGMCTTDETATTEATCPSGMCMDGVNTTEATCPSGLWYTGMCMDGVNTTEATCPSGMWMALGWMSFADEAADDVASIIFGADGVFTNPDGEIGTYTVDGTTITIVDGDEGTITGTLNADGTVSVELSDTAGCYDVDYEEVDAADEDACDTAGGDWEDASSCMSMVFTLSTGQ